MSLADDDDDFELVLGDWNEDESAVKAHLDREEGEIVKRGYSVKIGLVSQVHGNFDATSLDNASVIVLRFTPIVTVSKWTFKSLKVELFLEPENPRDPTPVIRSYEPHFSNYFDEDVIKVKATNMVQGALAAQAPVGGLQPSVSASSSTEKSYDRRKKHKLITNTRINKLGNMYPDQVWWEVVAANKDDGIGDYFKVAMLIQRAKGSKFRIKVKAHASVGFMARFYDAVDLDDLPRKGRVCKLPRDGAYGPAPTDLSKQDIPAGINVRNLEASSTEEKLWGMWEYHVSQKSEAIILHPKATTPTATSIPEAPVSKTETAVETAAGIQPSKAEATAAIQQPRDPVAKTQHIESVFTAPDPEAIRIPVVEATPAALGATSLIDEVPTSKLSLQSPYLHLSHVLMDSRISRLRKIAYHHKRLAELHLEEANEIAALRDKSYDTYVEAAEIAESLASRPGG